VEPFLSILSEFQSFDVFADFRSEYIPKQVCLSITSFYVCLIKRFSWLEHFEETKQEKWTVRPELQCH